MLKTLFLSTLLVAFAFAGEAVKSPADVLYDKVVADNAKDAEKAYDAYVKALDAANAKVIKALETAKADLNDPKKGKLTIQERADAIKALDEKIKAVKDGALGEAVAAKREAGRDLLGETAKVDFKTVYIGSWKSQMKDEIFTFNANRTATITSTTGVVRSGGTWSLDKNKLVVMWDKYGKDLISYNDKDSQIVCETHDWTALKN